MFYFSLFLFVHGRHCTWKLLLWKWLHSPGYLPENMHSTSQWCPLPSSITVCFFFFFFFNRKYLDCFVICSGGYFIHHWKACKLLKPPLKLCNWIGLLILVWKYKLFIAGFNLKVVYVVPIFVYITFWWNLKHELIPLGFVRDLLTCCIWRLSFYFFKYVISLFFLPVSK